MSFAAFRIATLNAAAAALLSMPHGASAAHEDSYLERRVGDSTVRLPMLKGFAASCEESKALAKRAAAMTPKTSVFITCFVEEGKWVAYREGKAADLYPFFVVAVQVPQAGGDVTVSEFERMRDLTHRQLGDLLLEQRNTSTLQTEGNERLKAIGTSIKRENYRQQLQGFFETIGAPLSFSFLTSRSATITEGMAKNELAEVDAISTIYFRGKLLELSVVDQSTASDHGNQARGITASWLRAFRELNESNVGGP